MTTTTPKPRTRKWASVEREYNAPMRDILLGAHMQYGSFTGIAGALGVSWHTAREWWIRCGLPEFGAQDDGDVTIVICGEVT